LAPIDHCLLSFENSFIVPLADALLCSSTTSLVNELHLVRDVKSMQELVDSMVAMNQSLGQPILTPTAARFANFQRTQNASGIWPSLRGDTTREPAFREEVVGVLESMREELSNVSQLSKPRGEW